MCLIYKKIVFGLAEEAEANGIISTSWITAAIPSRVNVNHISQRIPQFFLCVDRGSNSRLLGRKVKHPRTFPEGTPLPPEPSGGPGEGIGATRRNDKLMGAHRPHIDLRLRVCGLPMMDPCFVFAHFLSRVLNCVFVVDLLRRTCPKRRGV